MNDTPSYEQIVQELKSSYDEMALARSQSVIFPWKAAERERFLKELPREQKTTLLELGAGHGQDGLYFSDHGISVVCVDISSEMVRLCRSKGLEAYQADFLDMPFTPCSFDAVYAMNSLLHVPIPQIRKVLGIIRSLLRPGGLFYYGVYGGKNFEGVWQEDACEKKRFYCYFSDAELLRLVSDLFEVVYFRRVPVERRHGLHFQSLILRAT
jgi:SAM-dependent methyltransferase